MRSKSIKEKSIRNVEKALFISNRDEFAPILAIIIVPASQDKYTHLSQAENMLVFICSGRIISCSPMKT